MNRKAWIGIILALIAPVKLHLESFGLDFLAPFMDVLPDVLLGGVSVAGAGILAKSEKLGK